MSEPTAGEWGVTRHETRPGCLSIQTPPPDEVSARMANEEFPITVRRIAICDTSYYVSEEENEANARLLAAAKELKAELIANRDTLIDLRDNHLAHTAAVVRAIVQKRIEAAEAAIAKAEGREAGK